MFRNLGTESMLERLPQARCDNMVLTVTGLRVARIIREYEELTERSTVLDTNDGLPVPRDAYAVLRRLSLLLEDELPLDFEQRAKIMCRTLCLNEFSDRYEPINDKHLDFERTIIRFLKLTDPSIEASDEYLIECVGFLDAFLGSVVGRAFINTEEGECYVHNFVHSEAFLGPLSENWEHVFRYDEVAQSTMDAFIDHERNIYQIEDPRLGPLPEDWFVDGHPMQHLYSRFPDSTRDFGSMFDPCMMLKALCERGIEFQEFKLVGWLSEKLYLELLMNGPMSSGTEPF
ncbi:MAG: hypothetical protein Q9188_001090 [Gyalolechia gomerana]